MRIALAMISVGMMLSFTPVARAGIIGIGFDALSTGQDVLDFYSFEGVFFEPGWIVSPPDVYDEPDGKSAEISGLATFNIPLGWLDILSFYYSGGPLTVRFYEEENGLGSLVGTLNLGGSPNFTPEGGSFTLFRSVVFDSASGNRIDALTNGGFVVPEPGALELSLLGMVGLILTRWRRRP